MGQSRGVCPKPPSIPAPCQSVLSREEGLAGRCRCREGRLHCLVSNALELGGRGSGKAGSVESIRPGFKWWPWAFLAGDVAYLLGHGPQLCNGKGKACLMESCKDSLPFQCSADYRSRQE